MDFEWDDEKNQANIHKHGISFETAQRIFEGPLLSWLDTREDYDEDRYISIGMVDHVAVIVVAHTDRDGVIRLISARPATRRERRFYEEKIR